MLLVGSHPGLDNHDTGGWHPERPGRVTAALDGLAHFVEGQAVDWLESRAARREELLTVHDGAYLSSLMELCAAGGGELDPDTPVSSGSWETARLAAGAGLQAIDVLEAGGGEAAILLARPPGHHAGTSSGMGFCLLNNVAVAAAALSRRGERVAIVDWDVHHGNGTQEIFWTDPSVLYVSVHQWPLYPGTGAAEERGGGAGYGTTVNLPMPPGCTGDAYLAVFDGVVIPAIERFGAEWVLVSAGFDAHRADPLAGMALTAGDFADLTGRLLDATPRTSRLLLFLEGGYDLDALRLSVGACAGRLLGEPFRPEPASSGGAGMAAAKRHQEFFSREVTSG